MELKFQSTMVLQMANLLRRHGSQIRRPLPIANRNSRITSGVLE